GTLRSLHQFVDESGCTMAVRLFAGGPEITECITPHGRKFTLINLPYFLASKIGDHVAWAQFLASDKKR
ncbi:MAG: hypothetical protein PHC61_10875, partial [Chitinivibrionales bacterium]|nr:hypothetical protein [Chitinivibrionales bacterium]